MGTFIEPFDFQTIFINYFLGNMELFLFALILVMSFGAAVFRMTNRIFLVLLSVSLVIFANVLDQGVYILILFITGLIIFQGVKMVVTR